MEIIGKLLMMLPLQSGIGRTGNSWQKQEFVIETIEQYPKKILAQLWGDKLDMLDKINIGDTVKMSFSIEAREYNGKWFNDVKPWKIELATENPAQPSAATPAYQPITAGSAPAADTLPPMASDDLDTFTDNGGDDLPF